jgi:hypothetical protein
MRFSRLWFAVAFTMLFVALWPALALAQGESTGQGSDPLGDLQKALVTALVGAATTAVIGLGKRAWDWLGHTVAGKKVENAAAQLGIDKMIATACVNFVDAQAKTLGSKIDVPAKVKEFLAAHGYVGDALDRMIKLVESQYGADRAMKASLNKLGNAAQNFQEAITTGQLAQDLAKLRAMDAAVKP